MILLSVGHHEQKQGAEFNGVTEYKLAIAYNHVIAKLLGDRCLEVPVGTLKEKVKFINKYLEENSGKHLAVEMHFNSAKKWIDANKNGIIDDSEMVNVGRGSESLYYPGSTIGKQAAEIVQDSLGNIMPPNRGAKEGWYQMNPAKGADYFLRKPKCIAIIIEPEFIDNLDKIRDGMNDACHSIANSLLEVEQELLQ